MSLLLVEQSGRRQPIQLNGKLTVGRGSASKLRIDHPLVSRDHAIIERTDAGYILRDSGSRNGTTVNDAPVKQPLLLHDGDRIAIGPTTLWFRDGDENLHVELLPTHNADEGVVFECECGARLWAPMTLSGATICCRRCTRDVLCPSFFTPVPQGDAELAEPKKMHTCSICLSDVTTADSPHTCEGCGAIYHAECWGENCGCAAYGCKQVNILSPDHAETGSADRVEDLMLDADDAGSANESKVPWDAALIGLSVVAALLGLLLFGGLSLITAVVAGAYLLRRRTAWVAAAVVLSLIGFGAGVLVSGLWWLQISPLEWLGK